MKPWQSRRYRDRGSILGTGQRVICSMKRSCRLWGLPIPPYNGYRGLFTRS